MFPRETSPEGDGVENMKNIEIANFHIKGTKNVGDEVCAPALYFPIGDAFDIRKSVEPKIAIYGGGAIAKSARRYQATRKSAIAILWGVGDTDRGKMQTPMHSPYKNFKLSGIRDYPATQKNKSIEWVPCASCMSPLFDNPPLPTKEVVFYGHKKLSPMGEINNDTTCFERVIKHLSSGDTVVTSSYHGVYWATLLGRKVICIPFGSKFFGFKHMPLIVEEYKQQKGNSYDGVLEECRERNKQFWEKVKCVI